MKDVPQKIRRLRELQNLTQEHLAECLGVSRQTYSKIEAGKTGLALNDLDLISKALGCPPEAILSLPAEEAYMRYIYRVD
ncbi:MAG: helix-turn-helix transcriptional regulator [Saprospiraceae bacterium]|jgi:transcriptional regulator with XRE-family HTH domain|nr:helix-turn-helix transcriptional regulator [Saprospiraceae bacterium]